MTTDPSRPASSVVIQTFQSPSVKLRSFALGGQFKEVRLKIICVLSWVDTSAHHVYQNAHKDQGGFFLLRYDRVWIYSQSKVKAQAQDGKFRHRHKNLPDRRFIHSKFARTETIDQHKKQTPDPSHTSFTTIMPEFAEEHQSHKSGDENAKSGDIFRMNLAQSSTNCQRIRRLERQFSHRLFSPSAGSSA